MLNSSITASVRNFYCGEQCCIDDYEEMMKLVIDFGAEINVRDDELWTPLHAAAICGRVRLCRYLCQQ